MRSLRRFGLVSSLLIVGVLGVLMAPLPSEAAPTITIDNVNVVPTPRACGTDSAYNSCWSIAPAQYGAWVVGNASSGNPARVLISDVGTAGSVDAMKMTGITFTPVLAAGTKVTNVVIRNTFNSGGGNPAGSYQWGLAQGGYFDPIPTDNVVGNRLKLTGTGLFPDSQPLGILDTSTFTTSTINNLNGSVTKSKPASIVKSACNTGSNRCAPTITYTYEITVKGQDTLVLADSLTGWGGTCRESPRPHENPLLRGEDREHHRHHRHHRMGPKCTKFAEQVLNLAIAADVAEMVQTAIAANAPPVETCQGVCTGTIVIVKTMEQEIPVNDTFGFTGTGGGITDFSIRTDELNSDENLTGTGSETFLGLATGEGSGLRTIEETGFPFVPDGDGDHDKFWYTRDVSCQSTLSGSDGTVGPTLWTTFAPTFAAVNEARHELGDNPPTGDITLRQGYVAVSNLAAGDTLTCTFDNKIFDDDAG